jgi:mycoredoxin
LWGKPEDNKTQIPQSEGIIQAAPVLNTGMEYFPPTGTITMFSTSTCGFCTRLKSQLNRHGITFNEVNIEDFPHTAELVASLNGGHHIVPTVLFPDGSSATNPSAAEVVARLN